ncbi:DNA polymerase delta subunit POL32 SCDLUD_003390 [Saccharomycodes ludwigii]|uniref:DNA polymerase delta subunit POL32 n=1 Tax=Saccharomycodes ludwigii TaxID=36035 RepID=UPI001E87AA74|nr:hypothetical protein SCDLUD_003390 [Saccharomycodes ludwigii]KAH3900411.1 hypothetical protein SCDLUD_003390 [Saccharomycodes ludwigii]
MSNTKPSTNSDIMMTIDKYIYDTLISSTSSTKTTINIHDISEQFIITPNKAKLELYKYYLNTTTINNNNHGLTFNIMKVFTTNTNNGINTNNNYHFQLVDEGSVLADEDPLNCKDIVDVFIYSVEKKGDVSAKSVRNMGSLETVSDLYTNVLQIKHDLMLSKEENESKEKIDKDTKNSTFVPNPDVSSEAIGTGNSTTTDVVDSTPTVAKTTAKKSRFMGLRSIEILERRRKEQKLKEEERLIKVNEKRNKERKNISDKGNQNDDDDDDDSFKKKEELAKLQNLFDDEEDKDNEMRENAKEEEEECTGDKTGKKNNGINGKELKKEENILTTDNNTNKMPLDELEMLLDTTNDDNSLIELKQTEDLPDKNNNINNTYVDEEGYIVTKRSKTTPLSTSGGKNTESNRPIKRRSVTQPTRNTNVDEVDTTTVQKNKKRKKEKNSSNNGNNIMSFFGKRKQNTVKK